MESTNISDLIENQKRGFLPDPTLQGLGVIGLVIADQIKYKRSKSLPAVRRGPGESTLYTAFYSTLG